MARRTAGGIAAARRASVLVGLALTALQSAGCLLLAPRPDFRPGAVREREVVISVEGTPGIPFEGSYGTPARSMSVRGTVPARYAVRTAVAVVATFTKGTAEGELIVRVLVDGEEAQRRATAVPFGSLVVAHRFSP